MSGKNLTYPIPKDHGRGIRYANYTPEQLEKHWKAQRKQHGMTRAKLMKDAKERLPLVEAELTALQSFVRSLNSLAFEEWHGRYTDDRFIIRTSGGYEVASGSDALEAWRNLTADKPTDGGIFGPRGLCLNK